MKRIPTSVARGLPAVLLLTGLLTAFLSPPGVLAQNPGVITTVAGTGTDSGYSGDAGLATEALLDDPCGIRLDSDGNLFIADSDNHRVRMVPTADGTYYGQEMTGGYIYTIAGNGDYGYTGDGVLGTATRLNYPCGVTVDGSGNVYIADCDNKRIRKVDTAGIITTVAGDGTVGYAGDGGAATSAQVQRPHDVDIDSSGHLYVLDTENHCVRMVASSDGSYFGQTMTAGCIYTIAGVGTESGYAGDGGPATSAKFCRPEAIHVDTAGHLYVADGDVSKAIRMVPSSEGTFFGQEMTEFYCYTLTIVSGFCYGVAVDSDGALYYSDCGSHYVRSMNPAGEVSIYAGTGVLGRSGDGGPATSAQIAFPSGVDVSTSGAVYFSQGSYHCVRMVLPSAAETIGIDLEIGWNLVSVPVQADDMACDAVFDPEKVDGVYLWDPENHEYYVPVIIDPACSYWVASSSEQTIEVTGTPVTEWTYTAYEGWNMIGSLYGDPVTLDCLTTTADPDPLQRDDFYCWDPVDGEFDPATEIAQGVGYFLASAGECDLMLAPPSE